MSSQPMWNAVQLFEPSPSSVPIIDSELKHYGRLWVPLTCVAPTKALARWLKGGKHQPALCAAYQFGQCLAGEGCAQAHVLVPFMAEVRRVLQERPFVNCCHEHGDLASKRPDFQALLRRRRVEYRSEAGVIPILPAWLAATAFFDPLTKEDPTSTAVITFDASKVCNLHQRQQCTYGADCRNVHLCRNFWGCVPAEHKQAQESVAPADSKLSGPLPGQPHLPQPEPRLQRACQPPKAGLSVAPAASQRAVAGMQGCPAITPVVVGPPRPPVALSIRVGGAYSGPPVNVGFPIVAPPTATHPSGPIVLPSQPLPRPILPVPATPSATNAASPTTMAERPLSRLLERVCQDLGPKGSQKGHSKPASPAGPSSPTVVAPTSLPLKPLVLSPLPLGPLAAVGAMPRCSPNSSPFDHPLPCGSPAGSPSMSSKASDADMEDLLGGITDFSEDDSLGNDFDSESLHSEEGLGRPPALGVEARQPWAVDWLDAAAVGIHLPWSMVEELRDTSA